MPDTIPEETLFRFVTVRAPVATPATKASESTVESSAVTPFHRVMLDLESVGVGDHVTAARQYVASSGYVTRLGPTDLEDAVRRIGDLSAEEFTEEAVEAELTRVLDMSVTDFVADGTTRTRATALWDSLYAASVLEEARDADQIVDALQVLHLLEAVTRDGTIMGDRERWSDALAVTPLLPDDAFTYLTSEAARLPGPSTADRVPTPLRRSDPLQQDITALDGAIRELERVESSRLRQAERQRTESQRAGFAARIADRGGGRLGALLRAVFLSADVRGESVRLAPWRLSTKDIAALGAETRSALEGIGVDLEDVSIPEAVEALELERSKQATAFYGFQLAEQVSMVGDVLLSTDDFPDAGRG